MSSSNKSDRPPGAKPAAAKAPLKHRRGGLASMDAEQSARMLIFGVTAAVLITAVAFIVIGYYVSVVRPRGRTVLQVDQITVSYSDMKRRMAYEYGADPSFQNQQSVFSVPIVAYQNLLEELTLITRAESELGVTADEAEIETALRTKVGVAQDADDAAFAEQYRRALSTSRLHDGEYRNVVRAGVLKEKVQAKLNEGTPAQVPQAKVEVIAVKERAEAEAVIARIAAGEAWADVARAVSLDSAAAQTGGVQEFNYEGGVSPAYREFAFSAPAGEISTPLQDPGGAGPFIVVRVIERADMPLTDAQKPVFQTAQYQTWLEETQAKMTIVDKWSPDEEAQSSALVPLFDDAVIKTRQQLEEQQRPQPTIVIVIPPAATPASDGAGTPAATVPADGQ